MQKNKVLQTKIKVLRKVNVLFVNKNKELQKKMKYCKKKISFANKNKELQNINEAEQKQWFCNTYFPWPYLLIYLQRCFYFAFQSSLSLQYRFHFALHVSARLTLWHCFDMGVESRDGGVYNRPGHASLEVTSLARDRSQLIQAPSLSWGIYCFVFWLCMYIIALTVFPVNVMFNKKINKKRHLHWAEVDRFLLFTRFKTCMFSFY